ncbi:MAG: thioredoxin [Paludibacteraceae bacterium]|nr:thioredoxin [Paludibacteraceae bacterium]
MSLQVTESNWEEILKGNERVVIEFGAPGCGPCRKNAELIETVAGEYEGKVTFCITDMSESPDVAMECGVRNAATILYFKNGEKVAKTVGAVDKATLKKNIDALL